MLFSLLGMALLLIFKWTAPFSLNSTFSKRPSLITLSKCPCYVSIIVFVIISRYFIWNFKLCKAGVLSALYLWVWWPGKQQILTRISWMNWRSLSIQSHSDFLSWMKACIDNLQSPWFWLKQQLYHVQTNLAQSPQNIHLFSEERSAWTWVAAKLKWLHTMVAGFGGS